MREQITPEYTARKLLEYYSDELELVQTSSVICVDYEVTIEKMASRIAEEKTPAQIRNLFGMILNNENEIKHFIEYHLPEFYEKCDEYVESHFEEDSEGNIVSKMKML